MSVKKSIIIIKTTYKSGGDKFNLFIKYQLSHNNIKKVIFIDYENTGKKLYVYRNNQNKYFYKILIGDDTALTRINKDYSYDKGITLLHQISKFIYW